MKKEFDKENFVFIGLIIFLCLVLFLGARKFISIAFKRSPATKNMDNKEKIKKQKERLERIKHDQKRLMRQRRQKIKDLRRKQKASQ